MQECNPQKRTIIGGTFKITKKNYPVFLYAQSNSSLKHFFSAIKSKQKCQMKFLLLLFPNIWFITPHSELVSHLDVIVLE